jgi:hypothetical protein
MRETKETAPETQVARPYQPSQRELDALEAQCNRKLRTPLAPRLKMEKTKQGAITVGIDHPDESTGARLLMEALGTADGDFLNGLLGQLSNAALQGAEPNSGALNFMIAAVAGMEPKDHVEAMLAAQMVAVHNATMTFARRLAHVENIPQQDSASTAYNKLCRTFAAQVEALKRYRGGGGEQRITVEHVTVNEGGQAIVGNVTGGGRGVQKVPGATS